MRGSSEERGGGASSTDLSRVHHGHAVRHLRHDAQIAINSTDTGLAEEPSAGREPAPEYHVNAVSPRRRSKAGRRERDRDRGALLFRPTSEMGTRRDVVGYPEFQPFEQLERAGGAFHAKAYAVRALRRSARQSS
jgi:hypothetical protein